jgi:hypothetical protein
MQSADGHTPEDFVQDACSEFGGGLYWSTVESFVLARGYAFDECR